VRKQVLIMAAWSLFAASALAVPNNYYYKRQISLPTAADPRMSCATAVTTGAIFFTDNITDKVWFLPNPLTATGPGDCINVYDAANPPDLFGSGSWEGISIDPNGTIFVCGHDTVAAHLSKIVQTGTNTWQTTTCTLPAIELLGGCTAVGVNKIAATGYSTGNIHFLTISGNAATEDPGSPIAPSGFSYSGNSPSCVYDSVHGKIYISHSVTGTSNGGALIATSNGTAAGTSFVASTNPLVADTAGESSSNSPFYQTISIQTADQVLMTGRGNNAAGQSGWQLVDVSTGGTNKTPYQFLDNTGSTAGQLGAADAALGNTFFTISGVKYLAVGNEDTPRNITIYQQALTGVEDWTMY